MPHDEEPGLWSEPLGGLAKFLVDRRELILTEWERAVRQLPPALDLAHPVLVDDIPRLLDGMIDLARAAAPEGELPAEAVESHALQRLETGFDLAEILAEYSLLRTCILRLWALESSGPDAIQGALLVDRTIDAAAREATAFLQRLLRQRAEAQTEALRSSERQLAAEHARLLAVIESLPAGVLLADAPSGKVVLANRRFQEIWRQRCAPIRSLAGYRRYRGFHPDGRPLEPGEWAVAQALTCGKVVSQEVAVERGDGTCSTILDNAAPVRDGSGEIVGAVVATLDISDRKRQELQANLLASVSSRLSESLDYDETLRTVLYLPLPDLVDSSAIFLIDERNDVRLFEVAHADPEKAKLIRSTAKRSPPNPERDHWLRQALQAREARLVDVAEEIRAAEAHHPEYAALLRQVGFRVAITAPMVARGRMLGILALATAKPARRLEELDLAFASEMARRAALAIDNARQHRAAEEAIRAREEVLAVVSHDLRNPLGVVATGAATLARSLAAEPPGNRALAEKIQRAARRMSRLVDDLVDLASIRAGRIRIERRPNDPASVVKEVLQTFEAGACEHGVTLAEEIRGPLPMVDLDRDRILQVFSNLLTNALHVTGPGGRVIVRGELQDEKVVFAVTDTGSGIASEDLPHIFDRYWRAPSASYRGAGLGLAIARGIVEGHGGAMWAESEEGAGSTFLFTLPVGRGSPLGSSHA